MLKLRAFAECRFQLWYERVSKDILAARVADLVVRWQAIPANIPQLAQAMVEQLKISIKPERVLDLIVAWEEVTHTKYDPDMIQKRRNLSSCRARG